MRYANAILRSVLTVALAAYALDCEAMATPQQAMQCCAAMHCASNGQMKMDAQQGMDCCKTMPTVRAPFLIPSAGHEISYGAVVFAVLPVPSSLTKFVSTSSGVTERTHAPPVFSPPTLSPLRI
jgi:hypothetical protein